MGLEIGYNVNIVFKKSYIRRNAEPRFFLCPYACAFIVCLFTLSAQGQYGGGDGTALTPYIISEPNHMQNIGANSGDWGKHFKLMADIDHSHNSHYTIAYYICASSMCFAVL